jgi:exodeoxyribonuclease VII large subunit
MLETAHPAVYVKGEVTDYRGVHSSGHLYFRLKDANAVLEMACFRGNVQKLRFSLEEGMEVVVFGRLSAYARSSKFQVIVESIEPGGLGALQMKIEQLKKKLEAEGLFSPARKRKLPELPHRIALVTSPEGAAIRDFLKVTRTRFPGQHITIYPVQVQGAAAPAQIVQAIAEANLSGGFEVLVLTRGGGSLEDLMAFNDEGVARAVAESRIPVVCGVGHERDISIADFVADVRAATPSQAAEIITPSRPEILAGLMDTRRRLERQVRSAVETAAQDLDDAEEALLGGIRDLLKDTASTVRELGTRVRAAAPQQVLARQRESLEQFTARIIAIAGRRMQEGRQRLAAMSGKLDALSPLGVLQRGYSIAFALPGRTVVKDASTVTAGQEIEIKLLKGRIRSTVRSTEES